jgi:hypothetical protein
MREILSYFKNVWGIWYIIIILGSFFVTAASIAYLISTDPVIGIATAVFLILIFYFVYQWIFASEVEASRILKIGLPAEATVLKAKETGTVVNNIYYGVDFQLEVRPPNRAPYQTEVRGLIPIVTMAQFQPGMVVPVMVDPKNPKKIALIPISEVKPAPPSPEEKLVPSKVEGKKIEEMIKKIELASQEILEKGEPDPALILKSWETGINVNGENPLMGFMLEVRPANRLIFTAEAKAVVGKASVPKYQAGRIIYVKFDSQDTSKVSIDHS